jgi:hypothetical protein
MAQANETDGVIKDCVAARALAELVISMNMITNKGMLARRLARAVLGVDDHGSAPDVSVITTNGTVRVIPNDEPIFLIRGQDVAGGDAVRAWADLAEARGASPEIVQIAREHATKIDAWATKKVPDLPDPASNLR